MKERKNIIITTGCPKGIGPEIAVLAASKLADIYNIQLYGDEQILNKAAQLFGITSNLNIHHIKAAHAEPEKLTLKECGEYSHNILRQATIDVSNDKNSVLVTCPINKNHWEKAGVSFIGHTEFLADFCNVSSYAMMMASPKLIVTLATTHVPMSQLSKTLSKKSITDAIRLTHDFFKKHKQLDKPKIAVTGFNPHCGDSGILGSEEKDFIKPAIDQINNIDVYGPLPGDSTFYYATKGKYNAVVSMYHDQGLAAIKTLDFLNTVNVTLGLPIIRTSVDHGTAEDIAWQSKADPTNLIAAITMAGEMGRNA